MKGDHSFSPKSRISGYWGYNRSSSQPGSNGAPGLPGLFVNYNDARFNSDVFRGTWDYAIRPTVFNHFYGGGNNWKEDHNPPQATSNSGIHWKDRVCVGNVPNCDDNLVQFTFGNGYSTWGGQANNGSENLIKMFADDVTVTRGKHTYKFGGQYLSTFYNGFGRQCIMGCIGFSSNHTARPLPTGGIDTNFTTGGGNSAYDVARTPAVAPRICDTAHISGFQDACRVRPNLMLNLGRVGDTLLPTGENDYWSDPRSPIQARAD